MIRRPPRSNRTDTLLPSTTLVRSRRTSRNPETIPRSVLSGKGILDGAECCKCGCALFGTNFELTCPDQRGVCLRAIFLAFLVGDRPVPAFAYIAQAGGYASIKHWRLRLDRRDLRKRRSAS